MERGAESTFHTQVEKADEEQMQPVLTLEYIESLRDKVQDHLSTWSQVRLAFQSRTRRILLFLPN